MLRRSLCTRSDVIEYRLTKPDGYGRCLSSSASIAWVNFCAGIVESNPTLQEFANKLQQINKEQYPSPDANWLVGNITSDLIQGLNTSKRQKYLQEWKQNADIIFSKENLNKLESLYGPKYREALENILTRMNSGKNRTTSGNRLTNRIMDYINASNAAIMFFNMRSAVLQTISAVNFINFGVNNPYKAGKAFANQPQYWKDFKELMNKLIKKL